jgi:hypothetical protein
MKKIIILSIALLVVQLSVGQACTIYRLKYVGTFKTDLKVYKIKLPTTAFLHGLEKKFIETQPMGNNINLQTNSLLMGVFTNAEGLFEFYKKKRKYIPIIFIAFKNGKEKEITVNLTWNKVVLSKIDDKSGFSSFELNLNNIEIE